MASVHRKLKWLVTVLVVVEAVVFTCWFYGIRSNLLLDSMQNWPSDDALAPPPPLHSANTPSLPPDPLLKVYIYDNIPVEFSVDVLERCVLNSTLRNVPKKKDNFMADVDIIRLFQTYPGRTFDPHKADLFVVPYPHKTHCLCNLHLNITVKANDPCPVLQEDIDLLFSTLSYYNRTTKKRHLFIASSDFGWCNPKVEGQPLLLTLGPKPEHMNGNIVIPYLNNRPEYQPSVLRRQDWNFRGRKFIFSYFYGTAIPRVLRPVFQQQVEEIYGTEIHGYPFVVERIKQWTPERQDYVYETYRRSIFCPCLPGDNAREFETEYIVCCMYVCRMADSKSRVIHVLLCSSETIL